MCRHRWRYAGSLSRAQCARCGLEVERDSDDGRWRLWRVEWTRVRR